MRQGQGAAGGARRASSRSALPRGQGHGAGSTKWQFTSYERDSESGLDYAIFRYDSSRLGRFMTPDPLAGSILNPQSLNRYAYVRNNPPNLVDPLGLNLWAPCGYCVQTWRSNGEYWYLVGEECGSCIDGGGGDGFGDDFPSPRGGGGLGVPGIPPPPMALPPCQGLFGSAVVSSGFGNTNPPYYSADNPHRGVDYDSGRQDFTVNAVRGGTVAEPPRVMQGYGLTVVVQTGPTSFDLYGGLSTVNVQTGNSIQPAQPIATGGGTFLRGVQVGRGPHVHLQTVQGPLYSGGLVNRAGSVRPCI